MKRILTVLVLFAGFMFLAQGMAQATTFSFGDESIYWPGWTDSYNTANNTKDVVGTPDLTGGKVVTDSSGNLTSISIRYTSVDSHNPIRYVAGDLFIDLDRDANWDYVVHNNYNTSNGHWTLSSTTSILYNLNNSIARNSSSYLLSNDTLNNGNNGNGFRNDHPVVISDAALSGMTALDSVVITDFSSTVPGNVVFAFSGGSAINVNWNSAIIGFAPTCANDVIYSQVPEPATLLLLGLGLFGMGIVSRKRFFSGRKG